MKHLFKPIHLMYNVSSNISININEEHALLSYRKNYIVTYMLINLAILCLTDISSLCYQLPFTHSCVNILLRTSFTRLIQPCERSMPVLSGTRPFFHWPTSYYLSNRINQSPLITVIKHFVEYKGQAEAIFSHPTLPRNPGLSAGERNDTTYNDEIKHLERVSSAAT